jgi:hypothetical protein
LKIHIQRKDDDLDVRRGKVKAVQKSIDLANIIAIELEPLDDLMDSINRDALELAEYVCVSDWSGDVKMYNLPVDSFDDTTSILTIRPTAYANEITAGDYITIGQYTTTHSKLPPIYYRYYTEWARHSILRFDSSEEGVADLPMMQALQTSILETAADDDDQLLIPLEGNYAGEWP